MPGVLTFSGAMLPVATISWGSTMNDGVGGGGHHGAEVLAGALVDQVAFLVADVGADDGDVGTDGFLQQILLAVDGDFLLAVLDDGAETRLGQHATETCTGGTDLLGQGALGLEGDLQLAGVHLVDGVVVGADMGGDEGLHLVVGDELADAHFGIGGVVADDGEVFHIAGDEFVDEGDGVAYAKKSSDHYGHAVVNFVGGLFDCDKFVHDIYYFTYCCVIYFKMQIYYIFCNPKKKFARMPKYEYFCT